MERELCGEGNVTDDILKTNFRRGSLFPEPDEDILRIYGFQFCPMTERVFLILNAKEIDHEAIFVNVDNKPEWLFEKSPTGEVPILELRGPEETKILYRSHIIVDFLESNFSDSGHKLAATDPFARAQDRMIINCFDRIHTHLEGILASANDEERMDEEYNCLERELLIVDTIFLRRDFKYLHGQSAPGLVDYMIWPWIERLPALLHTLTAHFDHFASNFSLLCEKFTLLDEYPDRMLDDEVVKKIALDDDFHREYYEKQFFGDDDNDDEHEHDDGRDK